MAEHSVAVLAGGLSHERDVSLRSGRRLSAALRDVGLQVEEMDTDSNLLDRLGQRRPDIAICALHGGEGENGSIQTILEMRGIPFIGTGSRGCRAAWDKPTAKANVANAGFATPEWVALPQSTFRELGAQRVLDSIVEHLGLPLLLKPDQGGSALGAQLVSDAAELPAAMVGCLAYGDSVLAEQYIHGTEVAVTVRDTDEGTEALPAVEIQVGRALYDYTARYTAGLTDFFVPARLRDTTAKAVGELATAAHRELGLRHISRTDAIIDETGTPYFLEVNSSPGLTETSTVPMAIEAAGASLGDVYTDLITSTLTDGS